MNQTKKSNSTKRIRELENAIKADCFDCMGGQKKVDCCLEECALYPYRPFKGPGKRI